MAQMGLTCSEFFRQRRQEGSLGYRMHVTKQNIDATSASALRTGAVPPEQELHNHAEMGHE